MDSLPKAVRVGLLRALGFLDQPSKALGSSSPHQWVHKLELPRPCPEGGTFFPPELQVLMEFVLQLGLIWDLLPIFPFPCLSSGMEMSIHSGLLGGPVRQKVF